MSWIAVPWSVGTKKGKIKINETSPSKYAVETRS